MNKRLTITAILTVFLASQVSAQIVAPKPYIIVTPASPAANKDSITVQVVLGTASNGCWAPTFTDQKFTIVPSMLAIYPPQFGVGVTYTTVPVPPGRMCIDIYDPVQFGPVFKLGKLTLGNYTVTDSGKFAGTFSVGDISFSNTGSTIWHNASFTVATDKALYYTSDSLSVQYSLTNNAATVQSYGPFGGNCEYDFIISLKGGPELYRQSTNTLCLPNIVSLTVNPGATITHDFPKFGYPAGVETYVAALDSVVLTVSAQLWGTTYDSTKASVDITIKREPLANQPLARSMPTRGTAFFTSSGLLSVSVPSRQKVIVTAFATDGRALPGISFSKYFDAGAHVIPLNQAICAGGVYLIKVKGETFGTMIKMISGIAK